MLSKASPRARASRRAGFVDGNRVANDANDRGFARACARHATLTNLDLGDNGIALEGCRALAEMLAVNTTLARLEATIAVSWAVCREAVAMSISDQVSMSAMLKTSER